MARNNNDDEDDRDDYHFVGSSLSSSSPPPPPPPPPPPLASSVEEGQQEQDELQRRREGPQPQQLPQNEREEEEEEKGGEMNVNNDLASAVPVPPPFSVSEPTITIRVPFTCDFSSKQQQRTKPLSSKSKTLTFSWLWRRVPFVDQTTPSNHVRQGQEKKPERDTIRILIPPSDTTNNNNRSKMTVESLGRCIEQALSNAIPPPSSSFSFVDADSTIATMDNRRRLSPQQQQQFDRAQRRTMPSDNIIGLGSTPIVGLFREQDEVFVPLSYILSNPRAYVNDVFSITRPLPTPISHSTPEDEEEEGNNTLWSRFKHVIFSLFFSFPAMVVVVGILIMASYFYEGKTSLVLQYEEPFIETETAIFHEMMMALMNLPLNFLDAVIEVPLKELYRYGPSPVGWEGMTLPQICARIAYYGDAEFWSRNRDECKSMYRDKERAVLHVWKLFVYVMLGYLVFVLGKCLVRSYLDHRRRRWRMENRDMIETYEGFNMMARQIRRAMASR